jgi:phosphate/sulfate permease|tara:strand:- start:3183 stop:4151 length:969 start_codon:yes stop_codon:yes gene_type:complete
MVIGFTLAAYSVVANDSVQTLGTFIASNSDKFKWYILAGAASLVLCLTLLNGWYFHGDISYGRLNKIPFQEIKWYHAAAPGFLLLLTRFGIPVSTTFLVLSAFASTVVLEKVLIKSVIGYALAAVIAYVLWIVISRYINEKFDEVKNPKQWRVFQWLTTGFLWYTWLSHDMANIAVFLPRDLPFVMLLAVMGLLTFLLFYIFYEKGGRIQKIVLEKTGTRFVRSATIIDGVYAFILLYFKFYNDIPMSTTWVFVGLLCGRELAIATVVSDYKLGYVFPIIGKDFLKMIMGLLVSVAIVLAIHYVIIPGGYEDINLSLAWLRL